MDDHARSQGGLSVVGRKAALARLAHFVHKARSASSIVLLDAPGYRKVDAMGGWLRFGAVLSLGLMARRRVPHSLANAERRVRRSAAGTEHG